MKFKKIIKSKSKKSDLAKLEQIASDLGWFVELEGDHINISKYSQAGEDFYFIIDSNKPLGQQIFRYAEDFDVDEHVLLWAGGEIGIRTLLEDAEDIQKQLDELAKATREIW